MGQDVVDAFQTGFDEDDSSDDDRGMFLGIRRLA